MWVEIISITQRKSQKLNFKYVLQTEIILKKKYFSDKIFEFSVFVSS